MSRLAGVGAGLLGVLAWLGFRERQAQAAAVTGWQGEEATPLPPPPPAPPASRPPGGGLSPADVMALRGEVDPDGFLAAPALLAFVEVESSFRPDAYRYEPHLGEASYGLMQVLASTARDRGLVGAPEQMFDAATGLFYGVAQSRWTWDFLQSRLGREPTEEEWVGGYNAGVGNVLRGFIPRSYVAKWRRARDKYQGQGWA